MTSVELETGRPRGRDDLSNEPAVLLAKAEAVREEQNRVADAEKATLELREKFALEKLRQVKDSLDEFQAKCASLEGQLGAARSSEAKEAADNAALRLEIERDAAVHAAVTEASAAKLAASEARVQALQAQVETALAKRNGDGRPAPRACYRVDDGGAVAFRKSPSSDDRSTQAAEAGLLIDEVGRVVKADGEVWIQHTNELWLPIKFLEPYHPQDASAHRGREGNSSARTPEPEPEQEPQNSSSTNAPAAQPSANVSAMVAKLNSPKASAQVPVARLGSEADKANGPENWGDGGSAALARIAVRATEAECNAHRARADDLSEEKARLLATVTELKSNLRSSKRAAEEAQAARQQLDTTVAKLETESAVNNEKAISARRLLEEEKHHAAVSAKHTARAEERIAEMNRELTDLRFQVSTLQSRAVASAAELLAAEEAAKASQKAMDQRLEDVQRRCDDAIKRGEDLLTLQELAAANQRSAAAAPAPSSGNDTSAATVAAAEIKAAEQQRVIDALQEELLWHRRQQGRIERAVRICIKRTWRRSLAWWAFSVWRQSGTLSGEEPGYSNSQSTKEAAKAAEADSRKNDIQTGAAARPPLAHDVVAIRGPPVRHTGIKCDISGMYPITGNRYQKLEENFDLCEAEWLHLPEEEQKNYMLIKYPGAVPCSPFEADAEAEMAALQREVKRKEDERKAAKEAADEKARLEKEAQAKIQSKQLIAQGYGILFQAAGDDRDAAWDKAQKCFERALTWRADAEQAAKGLAELRALRAAASGNDWHDLDDGVGEDDEDDEKQQPLNATITDFQMQDRDSAGNEIAAYVEYTVTVKGGGSSKYTLLRRFSSFKALHKALESAQLGDVYPETPAIRHLFSFSLMTWFDTLDRDFIDQRAQWLRVYLSDLLGSPTLRQQPLVRSFLQLDEHSDAGGSVATVTAAAGGQEESTLSTLQGAQAPTGAAPSQDIVATGPQENEVGQQSFAQRAGRQVAQDSAAHDDSEADSAPSGRQVQKHDRRSGVEGDNSEDEDDDAFERRLLEGIDPTQLSSAPAPALRAVVSAPGNGHSVAAGTQQRHDSPDTPRRRLPANMPSTPRDAVGSGGSASSATSGGGPPELPRTPLRANMRATFAMGSGDTFRSPMRTGNAGMPAPSSVSSNFSPYLGEQRRFNANTPLRSPYQSSPHNDGYGNGNGRRGLAYSSPRKVSSSPLNRNFEFDSDSDFGAGWSHVDRICFLLNAPSE